MRFLPLLILLFSCAPKKPESIEHSDDYVLIEFASKLEEDYHRINQIPYDAKDPHHP